MYRPRTLIERTESEIGASRTEEGNDRSAHGLREVKKTGIGTDHERAPREESRELVERIFPEAVGELHPLADERIAKFDRRAVTERAQDDELVIRARSSMPLDPFDVMFGRPFFPHPSRRGHYSNAHTFD